MNFIYNLIGTPLGYVMWAIYKVIPNYSIALIIFVILVKAATLPLSIKQQKSTAKTRVLQPKLQALQKKYSNNKEKYQEEMMKLYEKEGYNPMSGCWPTLITFIVLFGIIDVVYKPLKHIVHLGTDLITTITETATALGFEQSGSSMQQIQLLKFIQSNPDGFSDLIDADKMTIIQKFSFSLFGMDLGEVPGQALKDGRPLLIIIPILAGVIGLVSGIVSMRISQPPQTDDNNGKQPGGGMMKGMMYVMPIISVVIAWSLPAAIGLYWITSSLFSFVQTIVLNKIYSPDKLAAQIEAQAALEKAEKKEKRKVVKEIVEENSDTGETTTKQVETKVSEKEYRRQKIAEARKRMAEKYGEEYDDSDAE